MARTKFQQKQVQAAIDGIQPAIEKLRQLEARCMEQVIDNAGIVIERWVLPTSGRSVIVYGTPHWRDVFVPVSDQNNWQHTLNNLEQYAKAVG